MSDTIPCPLALVVVRNGAKVLFGRNAWRGTWELPGGMIDPGESPRAAASRELDEETGIRVAADALEYVGSVAFTLTNPARRELAAVYATDLPEGREPAVSDELVALRWSDPRTERSLSLDAHIAAWASDRADPPLASALTPFRASPKGGGALANRAPGERAATHARRGALRRRRGGQFFPSRQSSQPWITSRLIASPETPSVNRRTPAS